MRRVSGESCGRSWAMVTRRFSELTALRTAGRCAGCTASTSSTMPVTCSGSGNSWPMISSRDSLTNTQPTPTDQSAISANSTMAIRRPVKPKRLKKPRRPSISGLLDRSGEDIAGAAHRLDQFAVALDLLAQAADLQVELGAGQRQFAAVGMRDVTLVEIDAERRVDQEAPALDRRRLGAAQDGADARHQFARVEGLWQIIVGAHLEADDAVDVLALGRQHQDRHARAGAEPPADREPVFARQHDVEHHEIRLAQGGAEAIERRAAVAHIDAKALAREIVAQQAPDLDVVLDDENMRALVHPNTFRTIRFRKDAAQRQDGRARGYKSLHSTSAPATPPQNCGAMFSSRHVAQ